MDCGTPQPRDSNEAKAATVKVAPSPTSRFFQKNARSEERALNRPELSSTVDLWREELQKTRAAPE